MTVHSKPRGASVGLFNTVWPHLYACWSMLRSAAKVMLDYSNDALQPRRVTPRKVGRKVPAKRRAKAA